MKEIAIAIVFTGVGFVAGARVMKRKMEKALKEVFVNLLAIGQDKDGNSD